MAELSPGTVVAHIYKVREPLGSGGFGETYLADNTTLKGGEVVVKTVASPDQGLEEAQTLVALQSHHVIRVLAFDERLRAIVMERAVGQPLANLIGRIDLLTSIRIAEAVASALSDLERAQLVHRDVKPENIMVQLAEAGGRLMVKLIDFGIALRSGKPLTSDPVGSPLYCPYEQHDRNQPPHPSDDVYALGGVLFHLVANRPPFEPPMLNDTDRLSLLESVGLPPETSAVMLEAVQLRQMHQSADVPSLLDVAAPLHAHSEREKFILEKLDVLLAGMLAKSRSERITARRVEAELDSLASSFSEAATSVTSVQQLAQLAKPAKRPTATLVLPGRLATSTPKANFQNSETAKLRQELQRSQSRRGVVVGALIAAIVLAAGGYFVSREPKPTTLEPVKVDAAAGGGRVEVAVKPPENPVLNPVAIEDSGAEVDPSELAPVKAGGGPVVKLPRKASSLHSECVVDERWREGVRVDVAKLKSFIAKNNPNAFPKFEELEEHILDLAQNATTNEDCGRVVQELASARKLAPLN